MEQAMRDRIAIRELVAAGHLEQARERFAELVAAHQRRALRIAYQYLRDSAEADEAVQDAFVVALEKWRVDGVPPDPGGASSEGGATGTKSRRASAENWSVPFSLTAMPAGMPGVWLFTASPAVPLPRSGPTCRVNRRPP